MKVVKLAVRSTVCALLSLMFSAFPVGARDSVTDWFSPTVGKQELSVAYSSRIYDSEEIDGQGTGQQLTQSTLSVSVPISQDPHTEWLVSSVIDLHDSDTDARLPEVEHAIRIYIPPRHG